MGRHVVVQKWFIYETGVLPTRACCQQPTFWGLRICNNIFFSRKFLADHGWELHDTVISDIFNQGGKDSDQPILCLLH